ncbi:MULTISPECIES: hypothetical protein [Thermocrispum]|jgi:hypothetical protein|uniref:YtxH domain-containing protein n=1 Tax=Thermocrispum agreste TaxID=37925 RepID=A0A2W4JPC3_9PSEU|nr:MULTISPECIES: hypothetical protein [Thermocrispum]PZM99595.1 MAG: hypothetical protein DIU77_05460 [Thermocrispum agreste]
MVRILLAAAVGYVLGTRAGRSRYEQMVRGYRKLAEHPAVQSAAGVARAKVSEKVPFVTEPGKSKPAAATASASNPQPGEAQH